MQTWSTQPGQVKSWKVILLTLNVPSWMLMMCQSQSLSETAVVLGFSTQPSLGFTKNDPEKRKYPASSSFLGENGQRRMVRMLKVGKKETVTEEQQKSIFEHATHSTLKHIGYSSIKW